VQGVNICNNFNVLDLYTISRNWDSIVGLVTRLWVGQHRNNGAIPGKSKRISSFSSSMQTGPGSHSVSYLIGKRGSSPREKQPGHKADHSLPSGVKVNALAPDFFFKF
jgi:hypothetical protein